ATSSETPLNARKLPYATSSDLIFSTINPLLAEIGFDHRRVPDHVGRRAARDQPAMVERAEMIRKLHHGVHGVLDDHNGNAFAVHLPDDQQDIFEFVVSEAGKRLVEQ